MKYVNLYFLEDVLTPLVGGADNDEFDYLINFNSNDEKLMKELIVKYFLPFFESTTDLYKEKFKYTLSYYLNQPKLDFGRFFYSNLIPFRPPLQPINFFLWMWDVFFPNETYNLSDIDEVVEKEDPYEPTKLNKKLN